MAPVYTYNGVNSLCIKGYASVVLNASGRLEGVFNEPKIEGKTLLLTFLIGPKIIQPDAPIYRLGNSVKIQSVYVHGHAKLKLDSSRFIRTANFEAKASGFSHLTLPNSNYNALNVHGCDSARIECEAKVNKFNAHLTNKAKAYNFLVNKIGNLRVGYYCRLDLRTLHDVDAETDSDSDSN